MKYRCSWHRIRILPKNQAGQKLKISKTTIRIKWRKAPLPPQGGVKKEKKIPEQSGIFFCSLLKAIGCGDLTASICNSESSVGDIILPLYPLKGTKEYSDECFYVNENIWLIRMVLKSPFRGLGGQTFSSLRRWKVSYTHTKYLIRRTHQSSPFRGLGGR